MLRRATLALATALGIALIAGPAEAITNGTADGNAHPNVGGLVADEAYSDGTWIYCSGTLISPTVFLTAAHCAEGDDDRVRVTFFRVPGRRHRVCGDVPRRPAVREEPERPARHRRRRSGPGRHVHHSGALPAAGSLADLPKSQPITSVGYGAFDVVTAGPGGHDFLYNDVRIPGGREP